MALHKWFSFKNRKYQKFTWHTIYWRVDIICISRTLRPYIGNSDEYMSVKQENKRETFTSSTAGARLVGLSSKRKTIPTAQTPLRAPNTTFLVSRSICVLPWNLMNTNRFPKNKLKIIIYKYLITYKYKHGPLFLW